MASYKLDNVVREYILENGFSESYYTRILAIAIAGLRYINLDTSGLPVIKTLPINSNDTIDLPQDFVSLIRIGVCTNNGRIHALGYNPKLCTFSTTTDCGKVTNGASSTSQNVASIIGSTGTYYADHTRNGEITGRYFGLGGGQNAYGYYRIDKANNFLVLDRLANCTHIVLEYLSTGQKVDGEFVVHPYVVELLKYYIDMKFVNSINNRSRPLGEAVQKVRMFNSERRKAVARFKNFTLDQALETIRASFKLSPKF